MAIDPKKPLSRKEMYLAKAAGEGDSVPKEPWSREEYYLSKIAEGGGGGGGGGDAELTYYLSVSPNTSANGVTLYSDSSCTTPISVATFFSTLRNGKTVWLEHASGAGDSRLIERYQIIQTFLTAEDTADAYNEVAPSATYCNGATQKRIELYDYDPSATTGAFLIN